MSKINKIKVGSTTYDVGGASGGYGTCTATVAGWTGTAPDLQQTITSGTGDFATITANDNPVLDVIITSSSTIDSENEAWSKVWKGETIEGGITLHASETPASAINVAVK